MPFLMGYECRKKRNSGAGDPTYVAASPDMRNDTRHMLESFFRPDVYDVAGLVPALNLHLWWPAYFHGSRSANAVRLSSM